MEVTSRQFLDWYKDGTISCGNQVPLNTILEWDNQHLAFVHEVFTWLFPIPECPAIANAHNPMVDSFIFTQFRTQPELRANMKRALHRVMRYYGFQFTVNDDLSCTPLEMAFTDPLTQPWISFYSRQHVHMTRILRSLRVLGLGEEAQIFYRGILLVDQTFEDCFGHQSLAQWANAMHRPLYMSPYEDRDDIGIGPRYLVTHESQHNPSSIAYFVYQAALAASTTL